MKIIDNFLPQSYFDKIQFTLTVDPMFPWYYNDHVVHGEDDNFQFVNIFYVDGERRQYYHLLDEAISRLNIKKLFRIKANLNPRTFFKRKSGLHIDVPDMTTSILYLNTNNGGTKFKNGKFVKSVSNRLLTFDSNLEHAGVTCTDKKIRVVVNFNYERP